jgi:hypothetical protein
MDALAAIVVLPFVSLLAGLASLYIDPSKEPKKKWILVAVLLLSVAGSVWSTLSDQKDKTNSQNNIDTLISSNKDLAGKVNNVQEKTGDILSILQGSGLDPAITRVVQQSVSATKERAAILPAVLSSSAAHKVTVIYYPKNVDGKVVTSALQQGGLTVQTGSGNPANTALPTNAIWVGDSVPADQVKFVALTLVRAGVGIVSIRRGFKNDSPAKAYTIEVGTDKALTGKPPMTVDEINSLSEIPARAAGSDLVTD